MDSVGVNLIKTAALGRPFQLGMLYDCRNDELIAGIRLWKKDQLELNTCSRPQINTHFTVATSDSIKDKSKLLNIEGELNLSVLGGLVQVSGAAKYLKDTKTSFIQQRLTLHYHSTSEFKELTVNQLSSENIPDDVTDMGTHVVTGILYGADACFVFDRQVSSDEDIRTVKGDVKVALEKLGVISADVVKADLNMNENEKTAVKNFTCTFYGDFQLPSNPSTFEDAMKIFADLPKLLKENQELVVPLRVWLYPLHKLYSKPSKLQKDISMDLIQKTESVIESLDTAEMKCSDLLEDSPALAFAEFHDKILQMKQNCYKYKLRLIKKLGSLLPNIRGDVMKETELNDLLQEHKESPFSKSVLTEWLKKREKESKIIKIALRRLKEYGAQVEIDIDAILMDLEDGNLVSYTFTSLDCSDMILLKQKAYLSSSTKEEDKISSDIKQKSWLTDEIQKTMKRNLEIFKNLKNSKDCKPAKFIVSSKEMKNNPGSCILLYESECEEAACFTPPSKPVCPVTEEVKGQSVALKVVPSSCPNTVELRLLYKVKQDSVWRSEAVLKDQDTVTLTDLRSGAEYEIKCAAVGKLNYTTESDVITVKTGRNMRSSAEMSAISSSPDDPVIQILLMGRKGSGKSSSGNTILGEKRFKVQIKQKKHEAENEFGEVCEGQTQIGGKQVAVIDCPDLLDPDLNEEKLEALKEQLVSRCSAGLSAVLLVVPGVKNVENEEEILDYIQCLLGRQVQKYIIILFTHGDELEELGQTIDEHLKHSDHADLQELVTECGGKFHCFNNKRESEDQVRELLQKIEEVMIRNGRKSEIKPTNETACKDLLLLGESPAEDPEEVGVIPERKDQIRLVLLGKTGSGKSATANTIIGRNLFKCSAGLNSVTKQCQSETRLRFGRQISVIDTPGLYDNKLSKEEIITEIAKCLTYSSPGPHAFIIVISVGRFTEEEKNTVKELKELFGEQIEKYTMILFTHKDKLEEENQSIEQYLQNGDSDVKTLVDGCRNQFFCLNNKSASFPQFKDLIGKIEKMVEVNGGHFANDQFEGTEILFQTMKLDEKFKLLGLAEESRCDGEHLMTERERVEALTRTLIELGNQLDSNPELQRMIGVLSQTGMVSHIISNMMSRTTNEPVITFSFVETVKVIITVFKISARLARRSICSVQ